jgi:CBS domain-containing protein
MKVKDYMNPNPITVSPETTFAQIAKLFYKYHFDTFPVVNKERELIGIISRTDLLRIFIPQYIDLIDDLSFIKDFGALELHEGLVKMMEELFVVDDLMTPKVVTVEEEETLFKAVAIMIKNRIRCLPVIKEKKLVGVISRTDILKAILVKRKIL